MAESFSSGLSHWAASISSWTSDTLSSRRTQLIATSLLSGSVAAGVVIGYQRSTRARALKRLKDSLDIPEAEQDPIALHIALNSRQVAPKIDPPQSSTPSSSNNPPLSKEDVRASALAARAREGDYSISLIDEQLTRTSSFLTPSGLSGVRSSFVIVVGQGGVGSHAAAALARSGVGKIRLIDFDQVTLSSLNRHAVATLADVGTPKVHTVRRRLEAITPWVHFDCRNELFSEDAAPAQLGPWTGHSGISGEGAGKKPDWVVDAIDNIDSKVSLLAYCHAHGIKVISSMGAGCKSDPTRVFVGDISASVEDPLSRATRRRLRLRGVTGGIPTVFSGEKAAPGKASLLPLPQDEFQKGDVGELSALPDFRVRILPVLGTMPAVFGLCVANHVLLDLGGYPPASYLPSKFREKLYDAALAGLQGSEERMIRWAGEDAVGLRVPVNLDDVGYLVEEVWRGKSAVSGLGTRLVLVRWTYGGDDDDEATTGGEEAQKKKVVATLDRSVQGQKAVRLALDRLVCMTKDEGLKHEREVLRGGADVARVWGAQVVERVERRLLEERELEKQR